MIIIIFHNIIQLLLTVVNKLNTKIPSHLLPILFPLKLLKIRWLSVSLILTIQIMDIQSSSSNNSKNRHSNSSKKSAQLSRNLIALIGQNYNYTPYRSKFEINSIASGKSRESRDSDLLNRLAKESSKASSKSLKRNISQNNLDEQKNRNLGSSNSNSAASEKSGQHELQYPRIEAHMMAPKIHNCVCFVAGECLNYNCNCFLSPFPCAPECCPNCLTLRSNLPHKITNMCSCKKTKCLKLYCECLSKGVYCGVMCRCELCQNHQNSANRAKELLSYSLTNKGCSCQKSHCLKKYCECYANKLKCTPKCGCFGCHNMIKVETQIKPQPPIEKMDVEEPQLQFQDVDFFGIRKR